MTSFADAPPAGAGLRGWRILGALTVGLLATVGLTPAVEWLVARYAEPARIEAADAIVALGGGIGRDGWLSNASWRRLAHGIVLHRQGLAPILVVSGSAPPDGPSEPEVRARLARDLGVPPAAILTVVARNTHQEALEASVQLRLRGVRSVLLVSSPLHLVRARAVFERQGFAVHPAPVADESLEKLGDRLGLMRRLAQELLGQLYYHLVGYL